MSELLVGLDEAARRIGIGLSTTKMLVRRSELKSIKVGKRRLIPVVEIEAFVARVIANDGEPKKAAK